MKHLFFRIFKILGETLLILLVLFAITLGIARSFFPQIDSYKPYFEKWASEALHQPVKIGKVQAAWKGLHPIVSMDQVKVLDTKTALPLLQVQRLQVGANLISSLLQRRLIPSSIVVLGTHLRIHRIDTNTLEVNGIPLPIKASTPSGLDMPDLIAWLLTRGQIELDDVDLDWENQAGKLFQITNLTAVLSNGFFSHKVAGIATLIADIPARFRFVINITQTETYPTQIRAACYVFIKNLDLTPWVQDTPLYGVQVNQGTLKHLQLWGVWENSQWQQVQALFQVEQVQLNAKSLNKPINLDQLAANILWQRQSDGFSFTADQIKLILNQQSWPLTQLNIWQSQSIDAPLVQAFQADKLDLNQLQKLAENIVSIPDTTKANLSTIEPKANLNHFLLRREVDKTGNASISASTDFSNLATSALENIPAVDGLQGSIRLTPNAGDLQLAGDSLLLDPPSWFDHPFTLAEYHGRIQWIKQEDGLKVQATDINFADANLGVRTQFNLWLPQTSSPYVQLLASFSEQDASHLKDYLPTGLMRTHTALSTWLTEAFTAGDHVDGQILLQGPLADFPFDQHTGQFEASVHLKNILFNYKTGWPNIAHLDADALFNGRHLDIQASQGNIFNASANKVSAQIPDLANPELNVEGDVQGNMQDGLRFIAESPLQKTIGEGLDNLVLQGPMQLALHLQIPLYQGSGPSKVQGNVVISPNGRVDMPAWGVHLTDFSGDFVFTEDSLSANNLGAKWLGQPINILIETQSKTPDEHVIQAHINGHMTVAKIQKEYGLDFSNKLSGETDYAALLQMSNKQGRPQTVFSVDSNLQGIAINLPDPLKKTPNEKLPTHLEITAPEKTTLNLFLQYATKLSTAITFTQSPKKTWTFLQGDLRLGAKPAEFQTKPGLLVDGYLAEFVWSNVAQYLTPLFHGASKRAPSSFPLQKIDLMINQFSAFGMKLSSVNITAQPQANTWKVGINNPNILGQLTIPDNLSQPIVGNFERFSLMGGDTKTTQSINPGDIPPLNLYFKNFVYGNKPFGAISLLTSPDKNVLEIRRLNVDIGKTHLLATGRWQETGKMRQQTTLSGNLSSDNIGTALKASQITSSVVGGAGTAVFGLSWPAAAYDFSAKELNGNFSVAFGKGSIINIGDQQEAEIGVGRILNLLSLQSIPRRLSLDFSDLGQKGFPFDNMKGDFSIKNGNAFTSNAYLHGPIATVEIKGRIGLANKDYDLLMMTTPHITGSLPLAATIIGGPIVGAVAWLGNKIIGGAVDSIAMHTYSVKGSWDNPVVETASGGR